MCSSGAAAGGQAGSPVGGQVRGGAAPSRAASSRHLHDVHQAVVAGLVLVVVVQQRIVLRQGPERKQFKRCGGEEAALCARHAALSLQWRQACVHSQGRHHHAPPACAAQFCRCPACQQPKQGAAPLTMLASDSTAAYSSEKSSSERLAERTASRAARGPAACRRAIAGAAAARAHQPMLVAPAPLCSAAGAGARRRREAPLGGGPPATRRPAAPRRSPAVILHAGVPAAPHRQRLGRVGSGSRQTRRAAGSTPHHAPARETGMPPSVPQRRGRHGQSQPKRAFHRGVQGSRVGERGVALYMLQSAGRRAKVRVGPRLMRGRPAR